MNKLSVNTHRDVLHMVIGVSSGGKGPSTSKLVEEGNRSERNGNRSSKEWK